MVRDEAEGTANSVRPSASASSSMRRRASSTCRSRSRRAVPGGATTTAWTTCGSEARAARPSASGSTGTSRHAAMDSRSAARLRSTSWRAVDRAASSAGRKSMNTPGRPGTPGAMSRSRGRSSGNRMPAPSLDAPSAANAPRWPSAPRPARASGSTRDRWRPELSATKPTPQASCSKRGSYSGYRESGRSVAMGQRPYLPCGRRSASRR